MYSIKHRLWTGCGHAISFPNKYQSMYLTGVDVRCATATGPVFFNLFLLGSAGCLSLQRDTPENSGVSGELSFPPSKSIGKRRCFFGSVLPQVTKLLTKLTAKVWKNSTMQKCRAREREREKLCGL